MSFFNNPVRREIGTSPTSNTSQHLVQIEQSPMRASSSHANLLLHHGHSKSDTKSMPFIGQHLKTVNICFKSKALEKVESPIDTVKTESIRHMKHKSLDSNIAAEKISIRYQDDLLDDSYLPKPSFIGRNMKYVKFNKERIKPDNTKRQTHLFGDKATEEIHKIRKHQKSNEGLRVIKRDIHFLGNEKSIKEQIGNLVSLKKNTNIEQSPKDILHSYSPSFLSPFPRSQSYSKLIEEKSKTEKNSPNLKRYIENVQYSTSKNIDLRGSIDFKSAGEYKGKLKLKKVPDEGGLLRSSNGFKSTTNKLNIEIIQLLSGINFDKKTQRTENINKIFEVLMKISEEFYLSEYLTIIFKELIRAVFCPKSKLHESLQSFNNIDSEYGIPYFEVVEKMTDKLEEYIRTTQQKDKLQRNEISDLKHIIKSKDDYVLKLETDLKSLKEINTHPLYQQYVVITEQNAILTRESNLLKYKVNDVQEELQSVEKSFIRQKEEYKSRTENLEKLLQDFKNAKNENEEIHKKYIDMKLNYQKIHNDHTSMVIMLQSSKEKIQKQEELMSKLTEENSRLAVRAASSYTELTPRYTSFEQVFKDYKIKKPIPDKLTNRVTSMQYIDSIVDEIDKKKHEIKGLKDTIDQLCNEKECILNSSPQSSNDRKGTTKKDRGISSKIIIKTVGNGPIRKDSNLIHTGESEKKKAPLARSSFIATDDFLKPDRNEGTPTRKSLNTFDNLN